MKKLVNFDRARDVIIVFNEFFKSSTPNPDVRIFSPAILLSSFNIYNSVGSIDENARQNLSLVINLTKHVHIKSDPVVDEVDPEEYDDYFPSFMWVARDFSFN